MHCTICGLPTHNIVGSVLPQCKCNWQAPQPPKAQRTWVGLTDEERGEIGSEAIKFDWLTDYVEAIDFVIDKAEAKLKERNT